MRIGSRVGNQPAGIVACAQVGSAPDPIGNCAGNPPIDVTWICGRGSPTATGKLSFHSIPEAGSRYVTPSDLTPGASGPERVSRLLPGSESSDSLTNTGAA